MASKAYGDELFIYAMAHGREASEKEPDADDGKVQLIERAVIDNALYMDMPADFKQMPLEKAKTEFSDADMPDFIFTDEQESAVLTFSLRGEELEVEKTEDALNAVIQGIQKTGPGFEILESGLVNAVGARAAYFEFLSPADDGKAYNLIFIFSLNRRLVLGSFNCLYADIDKWREEAAQMLNSIVVRQ